MRETTKIIYQRVCRGLFNNDRLILAFILATRIAIGQGQLKHEDWEFFLKGIHFSSSIV
jgi:hypothetical protein